MKKIGETFRHKSIRLKTIQDNDTCDGCYFYNDERNKCRNQRFHCLKEERTDKIGVKFILYKFQFGK